MERITGKIFEEERAFFRASDAAVTDCVVKTGESPFKHSSGIRADGVTIASKYPFWYSKNAAIANSVFEETARAGVWYTDGVSVSDSKILAPKTFRRSRNVALSRVAIPDAAETLWQCENVSVGEVDAKGDYLFMNSSGIVADGLALDGRYAFDGSSDVTIRNSRLITKDAFWNTKNVVVYDSFISSEYVGWNSEGLTFVRCTIESLQGFCYVNGLRLVDCRLPDTTLAFEYSSVDADVRGGIESVLDPASGRIKADRIGELTVRGEFVDPGKTKIECADIGRISDEPRF
ncbi:MAG: DUF3737 family protein [Clostridia bacterium]|nr:DUF3737 family protein [Clostridia bacterium]